MSFNQTLGTTSHDFIHELSHEDRSRIRWLMEAAPSDASAEFFVKKSETGFKAILKIQSRELRIVAGGTAPTLEQVIDQIDHDTTQQLSQWRKSRFS
ncbi:MAG: hypothetical protein NDI61_03840 [Bdellovibrionaceae bacterium]|nr:hypothetical protein [Pseudobdellovibrionaceae bacterium]